MLGTTQCVVDELVCSSLSNSSELIMRAFLAELVELFDASPSSFWKFDLVFREVLHDDGKSFAFKHSDSLLRDGFAFEFDSICLF